MLALMMLFQTLMGMTGSASSWCGFRFWVFRGQVVEGQDLGFSFGVWGQGFRFRGLGLRVQALMVQGLGSSGGCLGSGFGVQGLRIMSQFRQGVSGDVGKLHTIVGKGLPVLLARVVLQQGTHIGQSLRFGGFRVWSLGLFGFRVLDVGFRISDMIQELGVSWCSTPEYGSLIVLISISPCRANTNLL